jgi:ribosomal protein S18 acetylase RimI-like enzyme
VAVSTIVPLAEADFESAVGVAARAFQRDPALVFCVPDEAERLRLTIELFRPLMRAHLPHGGIFATQGVTEGVAVCTPPGEEVADDELMAAGFGEAVEAWGAAFGPLGSMFGAFHTVRTRVMPTPHWYCLVLAVEPTRQRQGLGTAMLDHLKTQATGAGVPVYLETDVPQNVPYYEGQGFRVVERHTTPELGDAPWWGLRWDSQAR